MIPESEETMTEHILHLRRHLLARELYFIGKEILIPGTEDKAFVGNGIHPDKEAHLHEGEYVKAVEIGESLAVPEDVSSVLIAPSPLARAVETAAYNFVGMARAYARKVLGVNDTDKITLAVRGLHKVAAFAHFSGLTESDYKNSQGISDEGNELVAEAYHKGINPNFLGYAWMVQKGFENDPRSEQPQKLTDRALKELIPQLLQRDVILSASHQPNLEIITAALVGKLGTDGNELFANAGGAYGMGAGFELRMYETAGKITEAQLRRTTADPKIPDKELTVDVDVLRKYV